MTVPHYRE